MKRIREIFESRIGFSVLTNMLVMVVSLLLFRPFWEEADDINMAFLAEGAYGYNEPHLLYFNYLYGKMLCFFQSILPVIRWHAVIMYAFVFVLSTTFVYMIAKDMRGKIISTIFLLGSFYEIYISFQFSKVATFVGMISYMIMFELILRDSTFSKLRFVGIIAFLGVTYSHLLRWESFGLATIVAGTYGICLVVQLILKKEFLKKIKSFCLFFIPVFAVFAVCFVINIWAYEGGEWKEYRQYFNSISKIVDYHYNALLYDLHGNELEKIGITENDANMLITYESVGDVLPEELMESVCNLDNKGVNIVNTDFIKAWIANIHGEIFTFNTLALAMVMLIGVLVIAIFREQDRNMHAADLLIQILIAFVVLFYYQYSSRWSHRVVYSLMLAQFVLLVYVCYGLEKPVLNDYLAGAVISLLLFVCIGSRLTNEFAFRDFERNSYDYKAIIDYMKGNKDRLFIGDVFTMIDYDKYNIFLAADRGQFDNYISADAVFLSNSPIEKMIAGKYGYKGPFDALRARDDRVILIDSLSPESELVYCNEHGDGGEYRLIRLETAGDIDLYSIR